MRSLAAGLLFALATAGAAVGSQIELQTPADGAAVNGGKPEAEGRRELPVVLKVQDVKGSYAIPFIQASDALEVKTAFAAEQVVKAQVSLLAGGSRVGEAVTTTPSGADAVFRGVAPGEYTIEVAGLDAAGKVVSRDLHGPVGVGAVIAALGDSITEGYHSQGFKRDDLDLTAAAFPAEAVSKDGRNYPLYAPTTAHHRPDINCFTSWMPRLNDLLTTKWKRPVFIANEGWGGITTGRYLAMMRSDKGWQERMRLLKPNVWLIHLGVNDERAKLPAAEVAANLSAMVDILRTEYGADPANIYLATPSYDYAPGAAEILAAYAQEIGKLIAETGLRRGPDFFTAYEGKRAKYYGKDPVHPNAAGVELMARLWAKALAATPPRLTPAAQVGRVRESD
jgi:lysophospholipase L1-like esterase